MTQQRPMIAGDWGGSHLRLFLCQNGQILATAEGPGVGALDGTDPGEVLRVLTADWRHRLDPVSVTLCGAIGSTLGWREAPYLECPADPGEFANGALRFEVDGFAIAIAPGLACINPRGAQDVLRGEETQIAGAIRLDPTLAAGEHLLCLPGTHTKWVWLREGRVVNFLTGLTGELFAVLSRHSMVLREGRALRDVSSSPNAAPASVPKSRPEPVPDAFGLGLARSGIPFVQAFFEARSRHLREGMPLSDAQSLVSGLLVGSDCQGALECYPALRHRPVVVIGAPGISDLYARGLRAHAAHPVRLDGGEAVLAGLCGLYEALSGARD